MIKRLLLALSAIVLISTEAIASHQRPAAGWYPGIEEPAIASNFDTTPWFAGGTAAQSSPNTEEAFRTFCDPSHLNYDDPILAPGVQGGSSHLHLWFGNPLGDYASTYQSLRTTSRSLTDTSIRKDGTCGGGPLNRSAYWMPAVFDPTPPGGGGDKVVLPDYAVVYYKVDSRDLTRVSHSPLGLRYIFGYNFSNPAASERHIWKCESGVSGSYDTLTALAAAGCTARIGVEFSSPECWDGENLTGTNGRSHVSNAPGDTDCPSTHPIMITKFSFIVWFSHNGTADYGSWYASCDRMVGHPQLGNGECMHTDWFGGWDPQVFEEWQDHCNGLRGLQAPQAAGVRDGLNCVASQISESRSMDQIHTNPGANVPSGIVYMAIPSRSVDETPPVDVDDRGHLDHFRR
jgi:hypothetical protein